MRSPGTASRLPFAAVTRALLLLLAVVGALLLSAPAGAFSRQDVTITSADGTALTATLTLPAGTAPAAGWPAVIYMHGLGGNRGDMLTLAQTMGIVGERYAVLAYDARGHGGSGGLIGIDGPKEIADVKAVFGWLRNRPDVADNRIGGWGVSYGGGAAWNSLVADVPWAALAISIELDRPPPGARPAGAREDRRDGRLPRLARPEARRPRGVRAPRRRLRRATSRRSRPFAAARSSLAAAEGRQDTRLHDAGPPRLRLRARARAERLPRARRAEAALDRPQRPRARRRASPPTRRRCSPRARSGSTATSAATPRRRSRGPSAVSPENWRGQPTRFAGLPKRRHGERRRVPRDAAEASPSPGATGSGSRDSGAATEVFGSPTVHVTADPPAAGRGSSPCSARAPRPARRSSSRAAACRPAPGRRTYRISLERPGDLPPARARSSR